MTKLEAVNEILQRTGQLPAPGLDTGKQSRAAQAERVLDRIDRQIQLREWHFNTHRNVELSTTSVSGVFKFAVPDGALNIRPEEGESAKFTEVGGFLFNTEQNTDAWAQTDQVAVRYVTIVGFESIPEAIAQYIAARAAFFFNDEYIKDFSRINSLAASEKSAKTRALQADIASSGANMMKSADARAVKGDRLPIPHIS